ncbi:hypothetical protein DFH06DRAFT_977328, partial [Mycena polygramma]
VKDASTLRRHLERLHRSVYLEWAKEANFTSMLPTDTAARRTQGAAEKEAQTKLDAHLAPRAPREKIVKYTADVFQDAVIRWIVATDQPISASTNPWFREMIEIASRAAPGEIEIPSRKAVRAGIMRMFKSTLLKLKAHLNVSPMIYLFL